jgi:hypothetical protein
VRARLIDRHLATCPHCSRQLLDDAKLGQTFDSAAPSHHHGDLWFKVRAGIVGTSRARRISGFRLATISMAAAMVLAVLFVPFHKSPVANNVAVEQETKKSDQIIIKSVELNDRPAKTFYFKSQDNDRLIVWVQ